MTSSSFYWAMRLLPAPVRTDMFALYGFCRAVDDIADGPGSVETRAARLAVVRAAIATFFATGQALSPELTPFAATITRHNLPRAEIDCLLDGMERDILAPMVAPSLAELQLYCRQVAGTVGLMAVRILGRFDADSFALLTAEALQLTNILRDLDEDAVNGRLYLPVEILDQAGIPSGGPLAVLSHPRRAQACQALAGLAHQRFDQAQAELARIGRHRLWPAATMLATYRALLNRLGRHGWRRPHPHPRLPAAAKLWIALRTAMVGP
ncbi:squalene/phytoene synthase family protein [Magnetospirillum moscoviense]|uniref:Phytoene synthase n=1 Tax=Magnetospirillum moscoviense TaxID=1437059 RepID=A0A178MPG9_9PROT|nr:squalene/phytoene synthase family protein [Magnetospirillum moscoviense]MBF0323800.1 squalene/phytoene synthase family protein [Alphaproteobacteria bacterium]OAN50606.1 hypothetical protein A6A05_12040 [Magnetospirillum moscoviense]